MQPPQFEPAPCSVRSDALAHWITNVEEVMVEYHTRAIISRGLYIFYPISKNHFFVFKEVFTGNSVIMYGLYSRAASNQERLMMARVQYMMLRLDC